jgi:hypothetical protein
MNNTARSLFDDTADNAESVMQVHDVFEKGESDTEIWGWDCETGCSFMMKRFSKDDVNTGHYLDDPVYQMYADLCVVKLTAKDSRLQLWISEI